MTAILPPLHPTLEERLIHLYAEVSGKPLGEGIGVLRDVIVAPTDEEAMALWADSGVFCGSEWFEPFGFSRGLVDRRRVSCRTSSARASPWSAPPTA